MRLHSSMPQSVTAAAHGSAPSSGHATPELATSPSQQQDALPHLPPPPPVRTHLPASPVFATNTSDADSWASGPFRAAPLGYVLHSSSTPPMGTPQASPRDADLEAPLLPGRRPAKHGLGHSHEEASVIKAIVFGLINTAAGVVSALSVLLDTAAMHPTVPRQPLRWLQQLFIPPNKSPLPTLPHPAHTCSPP